MTFLPQVTLPLYDLQEMLKQKVVIHVNVKSSSPLITSGDERQQWNHPHLHFQEHLTSTAILISLVCARLLICPAEFQSRENSCESSSQEHTLPGHTQLEIGLGISSSGKMCGKVSDFLTLQTIRKKKDAYYGGSTHDVINERDLASYRATRGP